jgi:hypothetical protein
MELNHRNIIKCKAASERGSASQEYEKHFHSRDSEFTQEGRKGQGCLAVTHAAILYWRFR